MLRRIRRLLCHGQAGARSLLLLLLFVWIVCSILTASDNPSSTGSDPVTEKMLFSPISSSDYKPDLSTFHPLHQDRFVKSHQNLHVDRTGRSHVLITWCKRNATFTLRHYLSLQSLVLVFQPDEIRFVYRNKPYKDPSGYHQWLEQFSHNYPFLKDEHNVNACTDENVNKNWVISELSKKKGGTYINLDVILNASQFEILNSNYVGFKIEGRDKTLHLLSLSAKFVEYMYRKSGNTNSYFVNQTALDSLQQLSSCDILARQPELLSDVQVKDQFYPEENAVCYQTDAWKDLLYPFHLHNCSNLLCVYLNTLYYEHNANCVGATTIYPNPTVPNIVHYVYFGKFEFSFMFYISVLSFIHIQKVSHVYIHCDKGPYGSLWETLVKDEGEKIRLVHRSNPFVVYNQPIKVVQHMADIAKAHIAMSYGGILADADVVVVQKFNSTWLHMDRAVVGLDIGENFPFPDTINIGLLITPPGGEFVKRWMESMKQFNDSNWLWNSGKLTYKIIESEPHVARIEPRLQVICYNFKCYPTWLPKALYKNLTIEKETLQHSLRNWATQAYSFHFTFPEPFVSETYLRRQTGLPGDVGRYVYQAAGKKL